MLTPPSPSSTLFPYTTLFRSVGDRGGRRARQGAARAQLPRGRRGGGPQEADRRGDRRRPRSAAAGRGARDRKSTRLNSSHVAISYAVFCLKKKKREEQQTSDT